MTEAPAGQGRLELQADCDRCVGLCCVALAFSASADFAIDKPAGMPCPNLDAGFRCSIHAHLRRSGFPGCVAYDCLGAGQHLTQATFAGSDWRASPAGGALMFEAFAVMRQLHELAWYLVEAMALERARALRGELAAALERVELAAGLPRDELPAADVAGLRSGIGELLGRASGLARADAIARATASGRGRALDRRGADLAGADLRGADLRGVSLRGAMLVGADLRRADLREADLAGADLRGADLAGADLRGSLFVMPSQLAAANGDSETRLPAARERPRHWVER